MMDNNAQRSPDQDLLERYVLGQLNEQERATVDRLIAQDIRWREALGREQRLAAGVRRLGRNRLKQRLSHALQDTPGHSIPWPRVLAAAASVFIIVGVVAVSEWYRLHDHSEKGLAPTVSDIPPEAASESPAVVPKGEPLVARKKESAPAREDEKSVASEQKRDADEPRQARQLRGAAATAPEQEKASASTSSAPGGGAWMQAQLYRSAPLMDEGAEKLHGAEESRRARNALEDQGAVADRIERSPSTSGTSVVTVEQRLFSSLAPGSQASLSSSAPDQIPARVEQRRDTLLVVLYPAVLYDENDLYEATIEVLRDDSLLITVAQQQIGLRLPAGTKLQGLPSGRR